MDKQPIKIKGLAVDLQDITWPNGNIRYDDINDKYIIKLRVEGGVLGYYVWTEHKTKETLVRQTFSVNKNELLLEVGYFSGVDGYSNLLDHIVDLFIEGVNRTHRSWYDHEGFPVLLPYKLVRKHNPYDKKAKRGITFKHKSTDFTINAVDIPGGEDMDAGVSLVNHIMLQCNRCEVHYYYRDRDDYSPDRYYGNLSAERLVRIGNAVHKALEPVEEKIGEVPVEDVEDIIEMISRVLVAPDDPRFMRRNHRNGAIVGYDTYY